jgi:polysaccharide chain length determinant protein (PEP-CTERM system associated)
MKAAWRYRWYGAVLSWLVAVGGWILVAQIPNRYEASARVFVDTQSVLRPLLAGLAIQPNVSQTVSMMSRTLISRPNVEKVIGMADLGIKVQTPEDKEELIAHLTKELTIRSAGAENLYTIAYTDHNPEQAKRIVQSLLTIFVEGSLGNKRKDTESAQRFINEQLKSYSDKLIAAEKAVTEFKRRNMALLGAEGRGYYARVAEAEASLNRATLELREAENSRDAIKKQLTGEAPIWLGDSRGPTEVSDPEIDSRIQSFQKRLDDLRLHYTEQHPDIVSLTRMIDQLKEQKIVEAKKKKAVPVQQQVDNPVVQQLSVALAEAEANVASLKARVAEYDRRYRALRDSANAVPQIDAEFTQLTRDYEVTRQNYQNLLARRESAQISQDMEASTTVVDFRVVDPPQVPPTPKAPNRPLLISLVLLAALGAGAAFAFLMSQVRPTFGDERRLREVSGLPVFGTVVMAWTDAQIRKRRRGLAGFLFSLVSLLSAYGAIMALLTLGTVRG